MKAAGSIRSRSAIGPAIVTRTRPVDSAYSRPGWRPLRTRAASYVRVPVSAFMTIVTWTVFTSETTPDGRLSPTSVSIVPVAAPTEIAAVSAFVTVARTDASPFTETVTGSTATESTT